MFTKDGKLILKLLWDKDLVFASSVVFSQHSVTVNILANIMFSCHGDAVSTLNGVYEESTRFLFGFF